MVESVRTILLVDPDTYARNFLASQLRPIGSRILEADDGAAALRWLETEAVKVVVTELYLSAGGRSDLIAAIRANKDLRGTRTVAHTNRRLPSDRDWAAEVGADAYLIKPTRAERMRYVVTRLTSERGPNAAADRTKAKAPRVQGVASQR